MTNHYHKHTLLHILYKTHKEKPRTGEFSRRPPHRKTTPPPRRTMNNNIFGLVLFTAPDNDPTTALHRNFLYCVVFCFAGLVL
ncbi:hypothetical protein MTR_3g106840 [Medicago truncatula]|uniref:Uncharacterized protein n=1 Tax=Medicago truncatula TaxID=3880 RepID=G7JAI4_MEDTR|nr:hypothetical protein MTR_3g106840 [Medicago truncatula]